MAKKLIAKAASSRELPLEGDVPQYLKKIWGTHFSGEFEFRGIIDRGKTGIAFKIQKRETTVEFCLKTVREELLGTNQAGSIKDTLEKEVAILRPLTHRCLPQVFLDDTATNPPFYVCTFHPGVTFDKFSKDGCTLGVNESFFTVVSLISVLEYLHENGRPHCDLHSKNVMIHKDVFRHGILLVDFGSGHRETESSPYTMNKGLPFVKDTTDKAHFQQSVSRSEATVGGKKADFRGLGALLATMANHFFVDGSVVQKAAYHTLCHDLDRGHITSWATARERLLSVIDPLHKITLLDRLFLDETGRRPSIPLPVSRSVSVGEPSLAVINSAEFQNLRRLGQLSFCEWRFPGATHTRFEHSLGVFNLLRKTIQRMCLETSFRDRFSFDQLKGCLLAGLVHDLGHYPLAHVVEQFAAGGRLKEDAGIRAEVSHLTHSRQLIEQKGQLHDAIEKLWGSEALIVCLEILEGKQGILASLLDGAVDCDKMDYLTRDAFHCGLRFGRGLDVDHLLRSFRVSADGKRLAVLETGVAAVEGFMVLQHQMLSEVYWHPTVRGIVCMAHAALAHITGKAGVDTLRNLVRELQQIRSNREAVEKVIIPAIEKLGPKVASELKALVNLHVVPRYTDIFRPVRTYRSTDERKEGQTTNIYNSINHAATSASSASVQPVDWENVSRLRKAFRTALEEKRIQVGHSEVIVDVPLGKTSHRTLPVIREDGSECELEEVSHLNRTIFEQPAIFVSPIRVYVSPKAFALAETSLGSIIQSAEEHFHDPRKL